MRFAPPRLQCIRAATINATTSSSRSNARGRNPWRRGFCDRQPPDGNGGGGSFVSGDSHLRSVRDANYGYRQGYSGDAWSPQGPPGQQFRPRPPPSFRPPPPHFGQHSPSFCPYPPRFGQPPPHFRPSQPHFGQPPPPFRPSLPPRPADFRDWNYALSQPPSQCERFVVISYNILADYLARDHRPKLYFHIPHHVLDWEWRKRRLLIEFGLWNPDIMCLQEVDRFHDLEEELEARGYAGIWKMRTGNAVDGCAIFWRTNRFQLRHEEHIEFSKLGLRDNVAQICVLESMIQSPVENASAPFPASSDQPRGANQVVICNIHVLYNPKRGEIKLGQVRVLLDRAYAISRIWNDAPVVICGDFNSTPKSALYNFLADQKLNLSGLARDQVSGQYSASIYAPRYVGSSFHRSQPSVDNSGEVALDVEQGSGCTGSHNQYKLQKDVGNASLPENLHPERSSSMLNISAQYSTKSRYIIVDDKLSDATVKEKGETNILDGRVSESGSTHCRLVDISKQTVENCNKQRGIPFNIGNDGKEQAPAVSCSSESCFEGIQQEPGGKLIVDETIHLTQISSEEHCSQSNPNIFSQSTSTLELRSSSGNHDLSQTFTADSCEVNNTSKLHMGISDLPSNHESSIHNMTQKESINADQNPKFEGSSESLSSSMASEEAVDAETSLDNKLMDDVVIGSSIKMLSGTFLTHVETSSIESMGNPSSDLVAEQKGGLATSRKNTYGSNLSDLSLCNRTSVDKKIVDLSLNEGDEIIIEDAGSSLDNGTLSLSLNILPCTRDHVSAHDIDFCSKSVQPHSAGGCQSAEKPASEDGHQSSQLEDAVSVGQGESVIGALSISVENSDPNFFKELLGADDTCEYRERVDHEMLNSTCLHKSESDPSSVNIQEDFIPVAPHAAAQEKYSYHPYNPYLWTPMEIEVASGNAECTFVEHNLKLRSAYTDVEDYAGTKDSSREPQVTSYNRQFMGTVDYIWYSEGLQTVKVLDTIPKNVLHRTSGFPTQKWGSDHIALACQLAFTKDFPNK